ncbi:putative N-acetylmannosamine-6-phosphate 2-epimerase [Longimycelium tulufanense]|uniref:Putative N-acetylmannosamine-6-phosphate 2-epimerase n=1 Tax=Longimycelium tulufanense TaxID=907463 RepID=A0A8J3C732_9PSEU|nr:putative N-acetylmannosamine-6-phosphate 2-epimerase [Longimycelium tulufanense]
MPDALSRIRRGLVVSCQAPEDSPLRATVHMVAMARAVAAAGAVGVRANGVADVRAIRSALELPVIGLWKDGRAGVYITPTPKHALTIAEAGADVVAVDGTRRPRPDGLPLADTIEAVHDVGKLVMADVADLDDGLAAEDAGADVVSTTLAGYTGETVPAGPDLDLVAALAARLRIPVVSEGRITTPAQARQALDLGAWSVVVGTAITAPQWIAERFVAAVRR